MSPYFERSDSVNIEDRTVLKLTVKSIHLYYNWTMEPKEVTLSRISSLQLTDNLWHHLAITIEDDGDVTVYIDGIKSSSGLPADYKYEALNFDILP